LPKERAEREALAATIGADGAALLAAIDADDAPTWLREVPAVEALRRVWEQNYRQAEQGVRWRAADDLPPAAEFVSSPCALEAHLGKKGTTCWVGYKVALTRCCKPGARRSRRPRMPPSTAGARASRARSRRAFAGAG
jgi:transposase